MNEKIPNDIVCILEKCGFDSQLALQSIDYDVIAEIEEFVNEDRSILKNTSYEHIENFKFKPGHRMFLLNLATRMQLWTDTKIEANPSNFSYILRTFIETADGNFGKHPKGCRFNEVNRDFSTYIYLMCGKACYETLSANLPIPKANTIRKSIGNDI